MKKTISVLLSVIMLFLAIFSINMTAFAEKTCKVKVGGSNDYTAAYQVLDYVNQERKAAGLSELTMDKDLLDAAMTRSIETSVYFEHTRPDGRTCYTACSKMTAENILAGNLTPEKVVSEWMSSPTHKSNILNKNNKAIGIGCFENSGTRYWVQCFSTQNATTTAKKSGTVERTETLSINESLVTIYANVFNNSGSPNYYVTDTGYISYGIKNAGWNRVYSNGFEDEYVFASSNPAVIELNSKGEFTAVGEGKATVSVYLKVKPSEKYSKEIVVKRDSFDDMDINIRGVKAKYDYTGKEITPKPTVYYRTPFNIYDPLTADVDYQVTYKNNVDVGTATVEVTGIGRYKGTKTVTFEIVFDDPTHTTHTYNTTVIKDATCTEKGKVAYRCSICGYSYTVYTSLKAHTEVKDAAVEATCTKTGLTEGSHCSVCNTVIVKQEVVPVTDHKYNSSVVKAATCMEEGIMEYRCAGCGDSYKEPIAKTVHKVVKDAAVEATCSKTGLTEGSHCSVCNAVIVKQEVIPVTDHKYDPTVAKESTCMEEGIMEYRCAGCGDSYTESIAKIAHKAVKDAAVEATCSKTGLTEGSHCSVCNTIIVKQEIVPVTDHKYDSSVAKAATCMEEGIMEYRCAGCGDSYTESIAKTTHKIVKDAAVEATCTQTGLTEGSHCSACNMVIVAQQTVPMTAHTIVTDAAIASTCTQTGLTEGSHCSICETIIVKQTIIDATGHNFVYETENDGTHTKVCTACDLKVSEDCTKIKQDNYYVCGLCDAKYEIEKPTEPSTGENPTNPSTEPSTNVKPTDPEKESTTSQDAANSSTESTTKEKVTDKKTAEKTTSKSAQKNNSKTSPATGAQDMAPLYITISVITVMLAAAVMIMINRKRNAYSE